MFTILQNTYAYLHRHRCICCLALAKLLLANLQLLEFWSSSSAIWFVDSVENELDAYRRKPTEHLCLFLTRPRQ